jgi:nucleoside-diphosphate-sugar epimerase
MHAPSASLALITGATGLLGSHIAERLVARGDRVRALVRPSSDTAFLRSLGVELVPGDLSDPSSCVAALRGAAVVYHAAAKVGDWGTWRAFQVDCIDATAHLAAAAAGAGLGRFVHISSTSAYGHPTDRGVPIDETAPLGQDLWWLWDYYTRSKVECERLLWRMAATDGLRLTVIRPSWLYGERDRTTVPRLVARLRSGGIPLIGRGDNPLSAIYAGEVAAARSGRPTTPAPSARRTTSPTWARSPSGTSSTCSPRPAAPRRCAGATRTPRSTRRPSRWRPSAGSRAGPARR